MPKGTFPESCCQSFRSRGGSLVVQASTGDPPTLAGSFGSVSCGVIALFLWVLVCTRFCLCPSRLESLFPPVLWKFCNQIPLPFKVSFPEVSQFPCQSLPQARKPDMWFQTFTTVGELLWYYCSPVCGSPIQQVWDLILLWLPPPTILLRLILCLWTWGIFF